MRSAGLDPQLEVRVTWVRPPLFIKLRGRTRLDDTFDCNIRLLSLIDVKVLEARSEGCMSIVGQSKQSRNLQLGVL